MAKAIFTVSVTSKINNSMKDDIRKSLIGNKSMAKEIKRVLQMANRRAQNIEKSGVVSTAYRGLELEGRKGYSKFSITGLEITNETQWDLAKYEYSKAIEFLNNPTSTSTGAKQYINYIAKKYDISKVMAQNYLLNAMEIQTVDSKIPFLNYRSNLDNAIKDDLDRDSRQDNSEMNKNAKEHAQDMENSIKQATEDIYKSFEQATELLTENLKNAFRLK